MGTAARILIFDSGVGGLSILQEIRQQYPGCAFFYVSDNSEFPYGTKPEEVLVERVDHVLHQAEQLTQADIIVVACNTASTVALPRIRERFSQPVIGVVPAIKPAAIISQSKCIGLLATPGTVKRDYTQQLINTFANDCKVISVGSSELVSLAERKLRGEAIHPNELNTIIAPFKQDEALDTLVLACTHFPLLKTELQRALPNIEHWVDSGQAIARRVGYWLDTLSLPSHNIPPEGVAYFTQQSTYTHQLQSALSEFGLQKTNYI